jgi:Zn finger protein HypA/HybF involved in hydrogenase expression
VPGLRRTGLATETVVFRMNDRPIGRMRCCSCRHEFQVKPGPHAEARCPACHSLYYEWLDYQDFAVPPDNQKP